jgi:hypothetical protein
MTNSDQGRAFPVTFGDEILGVVHRQPVLDALERGLRLEFLHQALDRNVVTIAPDALLEDVFRALARKSSQAAVVVDEQQAVDSVHGAAHGASLKQRDLVRLQLSQTDRDLCVARPVSLRQRDEQSPMPTFGSSEALEHLSQGWFRVVLREEPETLETPGFNEAADEKAIDEPILRAA